MLPEDALIECGRANSIEGLSEGVGRQIFHENAGLAVDDRFGGAALAQGHDGAAARLCLDRNHSKVLNPWQERGGGLLV